MTERTPRPVVVGVDGSISATQAVGWAAHEAGRRHVPLLLIHVWSPLPAAPRHAGSLRPYHDALVEQGRQWLADAAAAAQEAAPDITVSSELASGSAARHLIGASASADLVVLGSRGLGGFTGLLVGSIAVAVATHGHCPVVVVRGSGPTTAPQQDGPVIVGVDGSPTSLAALGFALQAAALRSTSLTAVHAWSDLPVTTAWELTTPWQSVQQHESEKLSQWLADSQAHVLLEHAVGAQLLVVGSRGRGGFRGLLLGSTSQALIHHAACPVAVVPVHTAGSPSAPG